INTTAIGTDTKRLDPPQRAASPFGTCEITSALKRSELRRVTSLDLSQTRRWSLGYGRKQAFRATKRYLFTFKLTFPCLVTSASRDRRNANLRRPSFLRRILFSQSAPEGCR